MRQPGIDKAKSQAEILRLLLHAGAAGEATARIKIECFLLLQCLRPKQCRSMKYSSYEAYNPVARLAVIFFIETLE